METRAGKVTRSKDTDASGARQPRKTRVDERSRTTHHGSLAQPDRRYAARSDRASAHSAKAPAPVTAALTSRNGNARAVLATC